MRLVGSRSDPAPGIGIWPTCRRCDEISDLTRLTGGAAVPEELSS